MDILRSRICFWTVRGAFPEISFSSPEFEFPELDRVLTLVVSSVVSPPQPQCRRVVAESIAWTCGPGGLVKPATRSNIDDRYACPRRLQDRSHYVHTTYYVLRTSHSVESCPLTKLNGVLSRLHSADEDAVSWLTSYG